MTPFLQNGDNTIQQKYFLEGCTFQAGAALKTKEFLAVTGAHYVRGTYAVSVVSPLRRLETPY